MSRKNRLWFGVAILVAIAISISVIALGAIESNDNPVNMLVTNATEDCKTSVNITWHSPVDKCTLVYTYADDTEFADAVEVQVDGTLGTLDYYGQDTGTYYKYAYTITGLTEDTKYIYKVYNDKGSSAVYSFVTAGTDAFRFIAIGDSHVSIASDKIIYLPEMTNMLNNIKSEIGSWDLTIHTGDHTYTGATYNNWVQYNDSALTTSGILAMTIGNHETDDRNGTGTKKISNKWFVNALGNPTNGPMGIESVYWFNYNGVLFLCLDSMAPEMKEFDIFEKDFGFQTQWMKDVVAAQEGKFQYIVVYQHFPMGNGSDDNFCSYSYYNKLYKVCDELGVDFVLGGDSHEYSRSKRLYNNEVVASDGDKGTVYVTNSMITEGTVDSVTKGAEASKCAARVAGGATGSLVFTVTETGITMQLVNADAKIIDETTIPSRRTAMVTGTEVTAPNTAPTPTPAPTAVPTNEPTTDDAKPNLVPIIVASVIGVAIAVTVVVVVLKRKAK